MRLLDQNTNSGISLQVKWSMSNAVVSPAYPHSPLRWTQVVVSFIVTLRWIRALSVALINTHCLCYCVKIRTSVLDNLIFILMLYYIYQPFGAEQVVYGWETSGNDSYESETGCCAGSTGRACTRGWDLTAEPRVQLKPMKQQCHSTWEMLVRWSFSVSSSTSGYVTHSVCSWPEAVQKIVEFIINDETVIINGLRISFTPFYTPFCTSILEHK